MTDKQSFKEGYWKPEFLPEWFDLWAKLWNLDVLKWEWQAGDLYSYNDSSVIYRIDRPDKMYLGSSMIPLPSWSVIQDMAEYVCEIKICRESRSLYNDLHDFSQKLVPTNDW